MNIESRKLSIIATILQTNDIVVLEEVAHLLADNSSEIAAPTHIANTTSITNTNISTADVKKLDDLFAKNMPQPSESLSIDEIKAMAAKAEAALQK